jgi:mannose-6-phosphate isomerase
MGTHPSCPSTILETKESLKDYLADKPELLGEKVVKKFDGNDLPFLFKVRYHYLASCTKTQPGRIQVLAIRKALSIQAHPNKKLAQKLHKEKPDIYKGELNFPMTLGREH